MSKESKEQREKIKDFAIIHQSPKGQVLVTKEPENDQEIITYWVRIENIGLAKLSINIKDEDIADEVFENSRDYEKVRIIINESLNQEYL